MPETMAAKRQSPEPLRDARLSPPKRTSSADLIIDDDLKEIWSKSPGKLVEVVVLIDCPSYENIPAADSQRAVKDLREKWRRETEGPLLPELAALVDSHKATPLSGLTSQQSVYYRLNRAAAEALAQHPKVIAIFEDPAVTRNS